MSELTGTSRVVGQIQNLEQGRRVHLCLLFASSSSCTRFSKEFILGNEKIIHGFSTGVSCRARMSDGMFTWRIQIPVPSNPLSGAHEACLKGLQKRLSSFLMSEDSCSVGICANWNSTGDLKFIIGIFIVDFILELRRKLAFLLSEMVLLMWVRP